MDSADNLFPRMVLDGGGCAKRPWTPLAAHAFKGRPRRPWQLCVAPAFLGVAALLAYGFSVDVVRFRTTGVAGFLIDQTRAGSSAHEYTAPGVATALMDHVPMDGWRPAVRFLQYVTLLFAFALPFLHCLVVAALYAAPLPHAAQAALWAAAEVAYGWSSLDVYVVSVVAAVTQFGGVAESFSKDDCREIDGLLAAFLDETLGGDAKCFGLAVDVLPGCFVLTWACLAHMVVGYLAGKATARIVAERGPEKARVPPRTRLAPKLVYRSSEDLEMVPVSPANDEEEFGDC